MTQKIGVLGAGRVGGQLGALWAKQGHDVWFGVRDPNSDNVKAALALADGKARVGTLREAAQHGDVILLAVNWDAVPTALQQAGDLDGKILIDATNRMAPTMPGEPPSAAQAVAQWAKGARVVKAFNSISAANLQHPQFGNSKADAFICGDDRAAKQIVAQLAQDVGFEVVDAGSLDNAALLEALAKLWVQLAYVQQHGAGIAFKLLRRAT